MDEAAGVHSRERPAQLPRDATNPISAKDAADPQLLAERLASDELHPETRNVVVFVGSVYVNDIRMTNAREMTCFTQVSGAIDARYIEQLESDIALEFPIPRAIYRAESPGANLVTKFEVAPDLELLSFVDPLAIVRRRSVHLHQPFECLQLKQHLPPFVGHQFRRLLRPIDARSTRN